MEQLLSAFWDLYDAAKVSSFREDLYILANQHQDILDAIMRKDLELSTQLMRAQFEDAEYQIITSLMK